MHPSLEIVYRVSFEAELKLMGPGQIQYSSYLSTSYGFRLLDLKELLEGKLRVIQATYNLDRDVPDPAHAKALVQSCAETCPFVAVSHVWQAGVRRPAAPGDFSVVGAFYGESDPSGKECRSDDKVSETVVESISVDVLRELAKRSIEDPNVSAGYLWVDQLCVMQDDLQSKIPGDKQWHLDCVIEHVYRCARRCWILPGGLSGFVPWTDTTNYIHRTWTLMEALLPERENVWVLCELGVMPPEEYNKPSSQVLSTASSQGRFAEVKLHQNPSGLCAILKVPHTAGCSDWSREIIQVPLYDVLLATLQKPENACTFLPIQAFTSKASLRATLTVPLKFRVLLFVSAHDPNRPAKTVGDDLAREIPTSLLAPALTLKRAMDAPPKSMSRLQAMWKCLAMRTAKDPTAFHEVCRVLFELQSPPARASAPAKSDAPSEWFALAHHLMEATVGVPFWLGVVIHVPPWRAFTIFPTIPIADDGGPARIRCTHSSRTEMKPVLYWEDPDCDKEKWWFDVDWQSLKPSMDVTSGRLTIHARAMRISRYDGPTDPSRPPKSLLKTVDYKEGGGSTKWLPAGYGAVKENAWAALIGQVRYHWSDQGAGESGGGKLGEPSGPLRAMLLVGADGGGGSDREGLLCYLTSWFELDKIPETIERAELKVFHILPTCAPDAACLVRGVSDKGFLRRTL